MTYHSYFYLVCTHCKVRQYIGADLEEMPGVMGTILSVATQSNMTGLSGEQVKQALQGIANHTLVLVKFLKPGRSASGVRAAAK